MTDNKELRTLTYDLSIKVATSLERVAGAMEKMNEHFEASNTKLTNSNNELIQRLDLLIDKVSVNNQPSSTQDVTSIETELRKRKVAMEKIIRNEEISNYYTSLINESQPFVRREYRTHVNKTTTERELVHRRQQSIDKVNTEIKVMQDRVVEFNEKKVAIDQKIEEYLSSHEDARADTEARIASQERTLRETFQRNSLTKMKESDEQEKMNSFEYLLKYTDSRDSLNYRGNNSRPRNRRASRQRSGRIQHEY